MAHRHDVYRYGPADEDGNKKYIEHEIKYAGKYGAKGERRAPRQKATPEQIRKQNQRNKEKHILRLIRENFRAGDLWVTLKFPKGTRMTGSELKEIRRKFLNKLRAAYAKRGVSLKYICRLEIGENGGPHMHIVINRLTGSQGAAEVIQEIWSKFGKYLYFTPLYEEGDFEELADYIAKPAKEDAIAGQLTLFGAEEDRSTFSAFTRSQNLAEPEPETHEYHRRTVRKLVEEGAKPAPGYYIDRDSIRCGVNRYTGMSYYYYTEIRLGPDEQMEWKERKAGDGG